MLAAESPIARAFPVRQGLISLSTGIGSFKYMPSIRTLQGSARNLPYSKSLVFRQGNKGLFVRDRSQPWPRPGVVIGTTPVFSTGKIRQHCAGFDKDAVHTRETVRRRLLRGAQRRDRRRTSLRAAKQSLPTGAGLAECGPYRVRNSAATARFRLSRIAAWYLSTASCVSVPSSSRKRSDSVTLLVPGVMPLPR